MKNRKLSIRMMFYILSLLIVIVWLIPFFITTFTSLKSMDEIMASTSWWKPPQQLVWENFANSWEQGNMKTYFRNTFIITVPSVCH
ncbi:MAG: sugar ABC transporter permease [Halanaerobium sp.]|nr:MAG: sugar ABC transporter permease [Halanaerobium sp.]